MFDSPTFDSPPSTAVAGFAGPPAPESEAPPQDAAAPARRRGAARGRTRDALLLGIHVTPRQVYGVLVRPTADGYEPLRQFVRNRADGAGGEVPGQAGELSPETVSIESESAEVHFGGGAAIDFSAEFAGLGSAQEISFDAMMDTGTSAQASAHAQPVVFEVRDILEECAQAGFARPALAFVVGTPDVEYVEMSVAPERKGGKPKALRGKKAAAGAPAAGETAEAEVRVGAVRRDRLLAQLHKEHPAADKERTAFVPMTARDGHQRYLAVVPTALEPVAPSLVMLREQARHRKTAFRTLEAEVPLLVGLARLTMPAEPNENTALVRVGAEDTVVLLLTGGQLHHYELMQSVTAFDGPDTICSRVLLQQDVQGVGTVHNVIVMAEERERNLVQGFAAFYPEARVETLREGMARLGLVGPYGPLAPSLVEATGAALAGHLRPGRSGKGPFEDANLLPESLRRAGRQVSLAFAWHTVVAAVLLFMSVVFFMYLYVQQKADIAEAEQRLAEYPPETRMSATELQARIDSLRQRQAELTSNLVQLDSLLVGTDLWTQTMLRTTRAAAQTGGVWIEEWTPNGSELELHGYATTRARVVGLAQRLDATIQEVSFQALREIPVFEYRMSFALPHELPQVTRVMREQAGDPVPPPAPLPLAGLGGSATPAPPPAEAPPAAPPPAPPAEAPPADPPAATP